MVEFKTKGKRKCFGEWVKTQKVPDLLHDIEIACYNDSEVGKYINKHHRNTLEKIAYSVCGNSSTKYKAYLKKGY